MLRLRMRRGWPAVLAAPAAALLVLLAVPTRSALEAGARAPEILWDRYGVPHVSAPDAPGLFHAFGYAQMHSHADALLRLYGESRGKAAEYWGARSVASDRWVIANGIPERAAEWYARQPAAFRANLDAFAGGINRYAEEHPTSIGREEARVLPVTAVDVLAHVQRVIQFTFMASADQVASVTRARPAAATAASNAWAIAGKRTESGAPILLGNPHLPWNGVHRFYEAHLRAPGIDAYGATLLGFPVLGIAFNDRLGWTLTVNQIRNVDLYALKPAPGGYLVDGKVRAFETREHTIAIRQDDGSTTTERLTLRRSIHGPIVGEREGQPIALRVDGLEASGLCLQWWDMARAGNLREFEAALSRLQLPLFNVLYADRDGHILYLFNGLVPERKNGGWSDWTRILPGDDPNLIPARTLPYGALPRVLDPPSGWLQNTNDGPWTTTLPVAKDVSKYPAWLAPAPDMSFRNLRSMRMLVDGGSLSFDAVVKAKHSTRMELADRVLDDLLAASKSSPSAAVLAAADVLARWDRNTDAESRGAVLFERFVARWRATAQGVQALFATPWTADSPLAGPRGLADPQKAVAALETAAADVQKTYGALDVAWGDVHRLRSGDVDLPANGGPGVFGIFRVLDFGPPAQGKRTAVSGDAFVMVVEFGRPVRAAALLGYGNASRGDSKHQTDQLALMARKELRPVWFTTDDVRRNLESKVTLDVKRRSHVR